MQEKMQVSTNDAQAKTALHQNFEARNGSPGSPPNFGIETVGTDEIERPKKGALPGTDPGSVEPTAFSGKSRDPSCVQLLSTGS